MFDKTAKYDTEISALLLATIKAILPTGVSGVEKLIKSFVL